MNDNELLKTISERITLGSYEDNGLLTGRAGAFVFLSKYSEILGATESDPYFRYINTHWEEVIYSNSHSYASGIVGIGVMVEELSKSKLFSIDKDEILKDLDNYVMSFVLEFEDISFDFLNSFLGACVYLLMRFDSSIRNAKAEQSQLLHNVLAISITKMNRVWRETNGIVARIEDVREQNHYDIKMMYNEARLIVYFSALSSISPLSTDSLRVLLGQLKDMRRARSFQKENMFELNAYLELNFAMFSGFNILGASQDVRYYLEILKNTTFGFYPFGKDSIGIYIRRIQIMQRLWIITGDSHFYYIKKSLMAVVTTELIAAFKSDRLNGTFEFLSNIGISDGLSGIGLNILCSRDSRYIYWDRLLLLS